MKCIECEHFKIIQHPLPDHYDAGRAECKKYNLCVDFFTETKLNRLTCEDRPKGVRMSTITNLTRDCIRDLQMLNEYIEMTYPEVDQVWLMDKVATAMTCVRVVEDALMGEAESED